MPRANRNCVPGYVWHITHRCHQKSFLFKFVRDRRRWRHWVFEARRRYGLSVLNYVATSNHVHLLCADRGNGEIPISMQLIAGRIAQEFNRRKHRHGAFWEDRYHATAVQSGPHLARCITYIDLNMVRAGAVSHPREWETAGYNEIQNPWQRKGVIDFQALCSLLNVSCAGQLADVQNRWLESELCNPKRKPNWTESVAVGDEAFVKAFRMMLGPRGTHREMSHLGSEWVLRDGDPS